jgi:hypothetical protein
MTKKKKIILGTIAGLCIAAVISVAAYNKNTQKTFKKREPF